MSRGPDARRAVRRGDVGLVIGLQAIAIAHHGLFATGNPGAPDDGLLSAPIPTSLEDFPRDAAPAAG